MRTTALISLAVLALLVLGCEQKPVAVVNGEGISEKTLQEHLDRRLREHQAQGASADAGAMRAAVLEELISEALLLQGAKDKGITVSEDEVRAAVEAGRSKEVLDRMLKEMGLTREDFAARVRNRLMIARFVDSMVDRDSITEEEVRDYYKESPTPFLRPEQVEVSFVQVTTREDADAIASEIEKAKGGFDAVAERLGKEGGAVVSGYGWTTPNIFSSEIAGAMRTLRKGEHSSPLRGSEGYFIIKVRDRKPEGVKSYEEAKQDIKAMFLAQKREAALIHWVAKKRKGSDITINN